MADKYTKPENEMLKTLDSVESKLLEIQTRLFVPKG